MITLLLIIVGVAAICFLWLGYSIGKSVEAKKPNNKFWIEYTHNGNLPRQYQKIQVSAFITDVQVDHNRAAVYFELPMGKNADISMSWDNKII